MRKIALHLDKKSTEQEQLKLARLLYTLGALEEKADMKEAALHYAEAAEYAWLLREEAALAGAELYAAQNNWTAVESLLGGLQRLSSNWKTIRLQAEREMQVGSPLLAWKEYEKLRLASKLLYGSEGKANAALRLAQKPENEAEERLLWSQAASDSAQKALLECQRQGCSTGRKTKLLKVQELALSLGAKISPTSAQDWLNELEFLVQRRAFKQALSLSDEILSKAQLKGYDLDHCRFELYRAKSLAGQRKWSAAADRIKGAADHCSEALELHAGLLFNAGKYHAACGRHPSAIKFYQKLEQQHVSSTLTDDSRLRAARSYRKMGVNAQFNRLLMSIVDDYPDGDMTMEGVLELALFHIERDNWSTAAQVLEHAAQVVAAKDSARGHEFSGTERYFLARSQAETGRGAEALDMYERLVRELPLSYYMLHAYSRLYKADATRAMRAVSEGLERARKSPFVFPHRVEYEKEEFLRAMEFLRVGQHEQAKMALAEAGLSQGLDQSLLWGIALLYDRAGEVHTAHRMARGKLTDWFAQYPAGDWRSAWEIAFPRPYLSTVEAQAAKTGVDAFLLYGVMREESTFKPHVVSHAAAYGLMQLLRPTARGVGKKYKLPYSVTAGPGRPIRWLRERPNLDFDLWVEAIPFRETRRYIKRVLASRAAYAYLYYNQQPSAFLLPERLVIKK